MKEIDIRNKQVLNLRCKGLTLQEIGDRLNLSSERVRQILDQKNRIYCERHNRYYKDICNLCNIKKNYVEKIQEIVKTNLMDEIERLSKPDRTKESVVQRQALVKILKDKYDFNFLEISKLLERDHTSIVYLYNKEIEI